MTFAFHFTSTHRDLLVGFEADQTARTGMRAWARMGVVGLGMMWFAGAVVVAATRIRPERAWQPIAWLLAGSFLLWKFLVKPWLAKRRLRAANKSSQEVHVQITDAGFDILVSGVGSFHRPWAELSRVVSAPKGMAFGFTDGSGHWLPSRVFTDPGQRADLSAFVASHFELGGDPGGRGG
jgi:hypothetical protein